MVDMILNEEDFLTLPANRLLERRTAMAEQSDQLLRLGSDRFTQITIFTVEGVARKGSQCRSLIVYHQ
jgi:hypothetical protein